MGLCVSKDRSICIDTDHTHDSSVAIDIDVIKERVSNYSYTDENDFARFKIELIKILDNFTQNILTGIQDKKNVSEDMRKLKLRR